MDSFPYTYITFQIIKSNGPGADNPLYGQFTVEELLEAFAVFVSKLS